MKNRSNSNKVVLAKRKKSFLEILGNIVVYGGPIVMLITILIVKWNSIVQTKTSTKIEFLFLFMEIIMLLVYYRILKVKVKEKLQANKINQEKTGPVLCFFNSIFALIPFAITLLAFDFLSKINEPIINVLTCILAIEGVGRLILFIDSFSEGHYE